MGWTSLIHFVLVTVPLFLLSRFPIGCCEITVADYIIESDILPDDVRFRPPIGNGHVATNVFADTVYMNGLYNGREDRSSRARIPAFATVDVTMTQHESAAMKYSLDMYNGLFIKEIQTSTVNVTITCFAHRKYTRLLVTQVDVTSSEPVTENVTFILTAKHGVESSDFVSQYKLIRGSQDTMYYSGTIREAELADGKLSVLHLYHTVVPSSLILQAGRKSLSVIYVSSQSLQQTDAWHSYQQAWSISGTVLLASHKKSWNAVWDEGRIDIHGNEKLSRNIAAATYNILCSLPSADDPVTPFFGLSPGGLSRGGLLVPERPGGGHNDYAGHIFWDMDTWVMPPIMLFHPDMARRTLGARIRVLDEAKKNAQKSGYKGAKFPWEQASTGIEATPKWAGNMSRYEIHVIADIAYSLRQYLYVRNDVTLLMNERGLELAMELARFWQSRVTETANGTVEILGVMGPDEYHFNVNNSVFTNYNAKLSLTLPTFIVEEYDIRVTESVARELAEFGSTAERIIVLFDEQRQYHPQYEQFNISVPIKQSDVVLLGYPLMMPMTRQIRRNDLELYEQITDAQGPDTGTWSMHTVGWLELGDEARAHENFRKMFRNINEPFKVFSEKPVRNSSNGGCVNFITGAGGLLQSIVFGYGGIRLHKDRMDINPTPLPNTHSWGLKGIHYKGAVLDISITNDTVSIIVLKLPDKATVTIETGNAAHWNLLLNTPSMFRRQHSSIQVSKMEDMTTSSVIAGIGASTPVGRYSTPVTGNTHAARPTTPVAAAIQLLTVSYYCLATAMSFMWLTLYC